MSEKLSFEDPDNKKAYQTSYRTIEFINGEKIYIADNIHFIFEIS